MTRIFSGIAAGVVWAYIFAFIMAKAGLEISDDTVFLAMAIVIAGAMAGGDWQ